MDLNSRHHQLSKFWIAKTVLTSFAIGACVTVGLAQGPAPTAPPIARKDQVIFELTHPIADPKNFNWFFRESTRDDGAHQVMWEPLFRINYATGQLEPWLATKFENPAPDTWIITLRDGVEWSDSKFAPGKRGDRPFTAADVVFTVQMATGVIKTKSDQPLDLPALEAVTLRSQVAGVSQPMKDGKPDPLTVVFKLKKPNPRFALENFGGTLFSSFLIMPKHIWADISKLDDPSKFRPAPIGTGPYLMKEITEKSATWSRDSDWWGVRPIPQDTPPGSPPKPPLPPFRKDLPKPLQLVWNVVDSEAASKTMLVANQLDAAREYTFANFDDAKSSNVKIVGWNGSPPFAWNDPCARQLDINVDPKYRRDDGKPSPWAADARLRKALSLLLDRKILAKNGYDDTVLPSATMFADYGAMKPFITAVTSKNLGLAPTADPAKAQTELTQAGYQKDPGTKLYKKNGEVLGTTIVVNADVPKDVDGANEVQRQLTDAGIQTKILSIPNTEYWGKVVPTGSYEIVYGWLSCGSVVEPFTSMNRYAAKAVPIGERSPGFNNTGRWQVEPGKPPAADDYAKIVAQLGALRLGDATAPDSVAKAYKILADEMPIIPLVQSPRIIPFNTTYWSGWPAANAAAAAYSVPMHSWSATERIIFQLIPN